MGCLTVKKISFIIFILCLLLTACNSNAKNNVDISEYEVVRVQADRMMFNDLSALEQEADLIVIGTYGDQTDQEAKYMYNADFGKDVLVYGKNIGTIRIDEYIKGKVDGDIVQVAQSYVLDNEEKKIIAYSDLTPMAGGRQWLFFLSYDEYTDLYWIVGDICGRYPLPTAELSAVCEDADEIIRRYDVDREKRSDAETAALSAEYDSCRQKIKPQDFGVYDSMDINLRLYNEIIDAYSLN